MGGLIRLVRWVAVVVALAGGLTLASSRVVAEGETPGDVEPLPVIVRVWDCPYEGASLVDECVAVPGVAVDVVADGLPVEGSGATTDYLDSGVAGVVVRVPVIGATLTASAPGVTVTLLSNELEIGPCDGVQDCGFIDLVRVDRGFEPHEGQAFVNVVVANCPYADTDVSDSCDEVDGAVVHVAVDGVEVAGSPAVTARNPINRLTAGFEVRSGATLTVWSDPNGDGFGPAQGYDPLTIAPESFYPGSCGGEVRCAYVFLIEIPVDDGASEPVEEPVTAAPDTTEPARHVDDLTGVTGDEAGLTGGEVVTRLPDTGAGPVLRDGSLHPGAMAAMLAWPLVAGLAVLGVAGARRRTNTPR